MDSLCNTCKSDYVACSICLDGYNEIKSTKVVVNNLNLIKTKKEWKALALKKELEDQKVVQPNA